MMTEIHLSNEVCNSEATTAQEEKLSKESGRFKRYIYNENVRSVFFQILLLATLGLFFYVVINNALTNLSERGISTGFYFLEQTAGFDIGMSLIDYSETDTYGRTFFVGLINTVVVGALGIIFATVLGFIVGVCRLSRNWLTRQVATVYIETFRNIPLLLQILFWYIVVLQALPSPRQSFRLGDAIYLNVRGLFLPGLNLGESAYWFLGSVFLTLVGCYFLRRKAKRHKALTGVTMPSWRYIAVMIVAFPTLFFFLLGEPVSITYPVLKGFNFVGGIEIIPELFALLLALGIYTGAFIAEIVRSGITSVSQGQHEAAKALGLSANRTMSLIVLPQAMRVVIPPLTSQYLNLVKNSSLAMAIGYPDLVSVFAGTTLNQTGQAIEIIAMTMAVYLTLSLLTSFLMNIYNRRIAIVER